MESIKQFFRMGEFVGQEALSSMARSAWMSWLVIMTTAVSLSILGGVWLFVQDLGTLSHEIGGKVPVVAFVSDEADPNAVLAAIKELPNVKEATLITKDQAWDEMQQDLKAKFNFDNLLDSNPLPNTVKIQTLDPEQTGVVAERVQKMQGIEDVKYGGDLLKKINELAGAIRTGGLTVSGILALASLAVIMNTIRLAVMARRREIEIMHLVGASNSFIAWPFLLEGMLFGLFGSALAGAVLVGWRQFTLVKWQEIFPFIPMSLDYVSTLQVLGTLAVIGMVLGAMGSLLSVHKHIRLAMAD